MSEQSSMRAEVPAVGQLSGRELTALARSGDFAVDESTGDRMIESLESIVESLDSRWQALQKLQELPPLSATATAQWMAGRTVATAADERGLLTQLNQARAELPRYVEAIRLAKRNYYERDDEARASVARLDPQV